MPGTIGAPRFKLQAAAPWHFLYLRPLPQGHGSLRPTLPWGTAGAHRPRVPGAVPAIGPDGGAARPGARARSLGRNRPSGRAVHLVDHLEHLLIDAVLHGVEECA